MIYESGSVSVDRDVARFGGRTFAIGQINSVEVRERLEQPSSIAWGVILTVIGLFTVFLAFAVGVLLFLIGCGFLFCAWKVWPKKLGPRWCLFLTTSSGQAQAFEDDDGDEIFRLRDAIEQAMAAR